MNISDTLKHQRDFLNTIKARKKPEVFIIGGVKIKVNPGVFSPATDTKLLVANIDIKKDQRFLELSTGSGVVAIVAGLTGATGVAVDINPIAVANARENIAKHNVKVEAVESDLYTNVPPEKFDRIYANGPFAEGEIKEMLDNACYGARSFIKKLFASMKNYLKLNGKALVVFPEWAETHFLEENILNNQLMFKVATKRSSNDGQRIYRLYEITR